MAGGSSGTQDAKIGVIISYGSIGVYIRVILRVYYRIMSSKAHTCRIRPTLAPLCRFSGTWAAKVCKIMAFRAAIMG